MGFFAPWDERHMWVAVQWLLVQATSTPWQRSSRQEIVYGTGSWQEQQIFVLDESYAEEDPHTGYMYKDMEKVWLSRLHASLCRGRTRYITCSDDCIWNEKQVVGTILQVYPYGSDDPEDTELQELMEYLESFAAITAP